MYAFKQSSLHSANFLWMLSKSYAFFPQNDIFFKEVYTVQNVQWMLSRILFWKFKTIFVEQNW